MDYALNKYYRVATNLKGVPLQDHLKHGFELKEEFVELLQRLLNRWKGRTGECVGMKNGLLRLRFPDTPGGRPDEAWVPPYLLTETDDPCIQQPVRRKKKEVDEAFGFDR